MEPVKQVLAMIDESGIGKMSYHDFYVSGTLGFFLAPQCTMLPKQCA